MRIAILAICFQVISLATTLTGTLRSPNSYGGATGTLTLAISQGGNITPACGGGGAVPTRAVSVTVTSGSLQSTVVVVGNDCISTSGTFYNATFVDASGNQFVGIWKITGSTFDISNSTVGVPNNPTLVQYSSTQQYLTTPPGSPILASDLIVLHSLGIPEVNYVALPSSPVGHPVFIVLNKQCDNSGSGPSLCHWNGSSWESLGGGGGGGPTGPAGGGLTGTYPNPTLANPNVATGPVVLDGSGNAVFPGTVTIDTTVIQQGGKILGTDISTPGNPASGKTLLYPKAGKWCSLSPAGAENCTGGNGSSQWTTSGSNINFATGQVSVGSTSALASLTIGNPAFTSGFTSYTGGVFQTYDLTGGSDFTAEIATVASQAGGTRQHNQMSFGYNPTGVHYNSADAGYYSSLEAIWHAQAGIDQFEWYTVYSNPGILSSTPGGYRTYGETCVFQTNACTFFHNENATVWQNRADGTSNIEIDNLSGFSTISLNTTSTIKFTGGASNAITDAGGGYLVANVTTGGLVNNLYRFAKSGDANGEVNFFQGTNPALRDMYLSLGDYTTANNIAIRWNHTTAQWEFQTAPGGTYSAALFASSTATGRIPFGAGTAVLGNNSAFTWTDGSALLKATNAAFGTSLAVGAAATAHASPLYFLDNSQGGFTQERTSGTAAFWTQYISSAGTWSLYNGADRLTVTNAGVVGIPGSSFTFNGKTCTIVSTAVTCT